MLSNLCEHADFLAEAISKESPRCADAAKELANLVHTLNRAYTLAQLPPPIFIVTSVEERDAILASIRKEGDTNG